MPWFQVDDTLCFHPKALAAKNAALGLWVRSGSWCMQNLTDGSVPTEMARMIGTAAEITRLVDVGLWVPTSTGFDFHQWNEPGRQRTKEKVVADRKADRERQAEWRAKRAAEKAEAERQATRNGHGVTLRQVPT